jgi:hypothetical protein
MKIATFIVWFAAPWSILPIIVTMQACNQQPTPIVAEPNLPCGRAYFQCPDGGCCRSDDESCGYGCSPGLCCYVGGDPTTWGMRPPRKQLTPFDARRESIK